MLLSATRIADECDKDSKTVFSLSADMAVHGGARDLLLPGDLVIYTSIIHSPEGDVCPSADYD